MIKDFFSLIFPQVCVSCGKALYKNEKSICMFCIYHLPKTNFHTDKVNPIAKIFWGRVPVVAASAYYSFAKGGNVQHLIHQLKYKGQKEVGVTIGKLYGQELKLIEEFRLADIIIPVPLHKKKQRKRGYNQSEYFAEGLSQGMNIKTDFKSLYRALASETQTRKSRFNRWKNVESVFQLRDKISLSGKHILLVDDVITTGATLEACAHTLLQIPDVTISIVTMAYATN